MSAAAGARLRQVLAGGQAAGLDGEYASDHWDATRLGVAARRGRGAARFDTITQDWLREAVKRWSRFRLATGCAFTTINAGALAMSRFSAFLAERHPGVAGEAGITRPVLEDYLSWLLDKGYSAGTRALSLSMLRVFTDACHRHGWLPRLAPGAVIYVEELPFHHDQVARFIPEFVMAQLESDAALSRIPHATTRNLVVVLIETGLRGGDACTLPFNPVLDDSAGWPCLRFEAVKVRAEQLIPLSARAAAAIRAQQEHVLRQWPEGSPWLFPGIARNSDGQKPYSHSSFTRQLVHWQRVIGLRDQAGQPVTVTGHQFRHTLGTRLINSGVPQHVVQKLLGHASPHMTAHYARIHDSTIREAFDRYQRQRVSIAGTTIGYDPDAPTATAEWVKHNLSRVQDSLPNGYCGRPPQQDCPHPNACLTCPDFQTTPQFLDIHRRQATTSLRLITRAEANGQTRLARTSARCRRTLKRSSPPSKPSAPTRRRPAMTRADNTSYLAQAAADRRQGALTKATDAIEHLDRSGQAITFSAVAATAGVSRTWLYRNPGIRDLITGLRSSPSRTASTKAAQRATADSLRARLDAARQEITRLRAENATLREQAARHLGQQRAQERGTTKR